MLNKAFLHQYPRNQFGFIHCPKITANIANYDIIHSKKWALSSSIHTQKTHGANPICLKQVIDKKRTRKTQASPRTKTKT
jgi:hypothetical protein